jgi:hypothetical protein
VPSSPNTASSPIVVSEKKARQRQSSSEDSGTDYSQTRKAEMALRRKRAERGENVDYTPDEDTLDEDADGEDDDGEDEEKGLNSKTKWKPHTPKVLFPLSARSTSY